MPSSMRPVISITWVTACTAQPSRGSSSSARRPPFQRRRIDCTPRARSMHAEEIRIAAEPPHPSAAAPAPPDCAGSTRRRGRSRTDAPFQREDVARVFREHAIVSRARGVPIAVYQQSRCPHQPLLAIVGGTGPVTPQIGCCGPRRRPRDVRRRSSGPRRGKRGRARSRRVRTAPRRSRRSGRRRTFW